MLAVKLTEKKSRHFLLAKVLEIWHFIFTICIEYKKSTLQTLMTMLP